MLTTTPLRVWTPGREGGVPPPPAAPRPLQRRLPNFLVIGAQKSGTTWLFEQLRGHPEVFASRPKELHYFSNPDILAEGWAAYQHRFRDIGPRHRVAGEATPNYLWCSDHGGDAWFADDPHVEFRYGIPGRIASSLGRDLRFVVMLRDPVERAVSAFYHNVKVGDRIDPELSFFDNARTWTGMVTMGFYAAHLRRFLEFFDAQNFLVLIHEEVRRDPAAALLAVQHHLRLREWLPDTLHERIHTGSKYRGPDGGWYYDEACTRLAITPEEITELEELYAPENERLEELLGRPLPSWRHARATSANAAGPE